MISSASAILLWVGGAASAAEPDRALRAYPMREVAAGTFEVSSSETTESCGDVIITREVTLSRGISVGRTEITQGLWQWVMGDNPATFQGCGATCPVESVSWSEAALFANAFSAAHGLEACYEIRADIVLWPKGVACDGYRLPTEAEWAVAAALHSGVSAVRVDPEHRLETYSVLAGMGEPGGFVGVTGNVWEWVWDRYAPVTQRQPGEPFGSGEGRLRVVRGGSWLTPSEHAKATLRKWEVEDYRSVEVGFRLVRSLPGGDRAVAEASSGESR